MKIVRSLIIFLATGFGLGIGAQAVSSALKNFKRHSFLEKYSGAGLLGTCVGMVFVMFFFSSMRGMQAFLLLLAITVFSVYISGLAEDIFGKKDDSRIVIDEIAGILWTFYGLPGFSADFTITVFISGFVLFRVFDILKLPFSGAQDFRGGFGIVLDDILAGLLANAFLQIALRFLP